MTTNDYIYRLADDFEEKRPGSFEKWASYLQERDRDDSAAVTALAEIEDVAKWMANTIPFAIKIVTAYIKIVGRLGIAESGIVNASNLRLQQALAAYTTWQVNKKYDGIDRRKPNQPTGEDVPDKNK